MDRAIRTADPVADAEYYASREPEIIGYCEQCNEPIYKGDDYIDFNDTLLHDDADCILDYVRQFRVGGE